MKKYCFTFVFLSCYFVCFSATINFAPLTIGSKWCYEYYTDRYGTNRHSQIFSDTTRAIKTYVILDTMKRNGSLSIIYGIADTGTYSFTSNWQGKYSNPIQLYLIDTCVITPGVDTCNCDSFLPLSNRVYVNSDSCRNAIVPLDSYDTITYGCKKILELNDSLRLFKRDSSYYPSQSVYTHKNTSYLESVGMYQYFGDYMMVFEGTSSYTTKINLLSFNNKRTDLPAPVVLPSAIKNIPAPLFAIILNRSAASAKINLNIPYSQHVTIDLIALDGKVISPIFHGAAGEKTRQVQFSTSRFPAGLYVVRLTAGGKFYSQKILIMK
jgi:hypothetical protein